MWEFQEFGCFTPRESWTVEVFMHVERSSQEWVKSVQYDGKQRNKRVSCLFYDENRGKIWELASLCSCCQRKKFKRREWKAVLPTNSLHISFIFLSRMMNSQVSRMKLLFPWRILLDAMPLTSTKLVAFNVSSIPVSWLFIFGNCFRKRDVSCNNEKCCFVFLVV